jgi:hypothetical protein
MRKIYFITLLTLLTTTWAQAQCNILSPAVAGILLDHQSTNLLNGSGVGFNPILGRYYAVRAGNATYPLETWSSTGTQLYLTNAGFDWRGMWWNPLTSQLEGNGFASEGIWNCSLDGSGWALNTGSQIFAGQAQPDLQSIGDFDFYSNEMIYYYAGSIYRYSRVNDAFLGSYPLLGIPVSLSNINSNTVVFTGCVGKEVGILDYVNKRVYLFEKNTGIFRGTSQLPGTASTTSTFRFSYANSYAWCFSLGTGNWYSFRILDWVLPENPFTANTVWLNPEVVQVTWESIEADKYDHFEVERSIDGVSFEMIGSNDAAEITGQNGDAKTWTLQDATAPDNALIYYRVKAYLKSGETEYSNVMTLMRDAPTELGLEAWPIPTDQSLHISFANAPPGSSLDVIDASGKLIYHSSTDDIVQGADGLQLDTQAWAEGIYLLRLKDLQGQLLIKRLVIQH